MPILDIIRCFLLVCISLGAFAENYALIEVAERFNPGLADRPVWQEAVAFNPAAQHLGEDVPRAHSWRHWAKLNLPSETLVLRPGNDPGPGEAKTSAMGGPPHKLPLVDVWYQLATSVPWRDDEMPEVARWLDEIEPTLEAMDDALRDGHSDFGWSPLAWSASTAYREPDWQTMALPHSHALAEAYWTLVARTMRDLGRGDVAAFEDGITAMTRLGELHREEKHTPTRLRSFHLSTGPGNEFYESLLQHETWVIPEVAGSWPLPALSDQYREIAEAYRTSERRSVRNLVEAMHQSGRWRIGWSDGRLTEETAAAINPDRVVTLMLEAIDQEADIMAKLPDSLKGAGWRDRFLGRDDLSWVPAFLLKIPKFDDGINEVYRRLEPEDADEVLARTLTRIRRSELATRIHSLLNVDARRRVLNAAGLIRKHIDGGGTLPPDAKSAIAVVGDEAMEDLDGHPLRYRVDANERGFTIYSVGADLEDQNGNNNPSLVKRDVRVDVQLSLKKQ